MKRGVIAVVVVLGMALLVGGVQAEKMINRLSASAASPPAVMTAGDLPPIASDAAQGVAKRDVGPEATSQLFWDDGTCEAGIGVGAQNTALMEFDVPTVCTQAGLSVIAVTARVNTYTASSFTLRQSGANPGAPSSGTRIPLPAAITGAGACAGTATTGTQRVLGTAGVVNGTANFFAGIVYPVGGYTGRDTSAMLGKMWLNCPTCGNSMYSSAALPTSLRGNLIIRVTVEDANCVPVELQSFAIE